VKEKFGHEHPITRVNILNTNRIEMLQEIGLHMERVRNDEGEIVEEPRYSVIKPFWLTADDFTKLVAQVRRDGGPELQLALLTPAAELPSSAGYEAEEQAIRRRLNRLAAARGKKRDIVRIEQIGGCVYLFYGQNAVVAGYMKEASQHPREGGASKFTYETEKRGRTVRVDLPERGRNPIGEVRVQFQHKNTVPEVLAWLIAEGYGIDGEIPAVVDPRVPVAAQPSKPKTPQPRTVEPPPEPPPQPSVEPPKASHPSGEPVKPPHASREPVQAMKPTSGSLLPQMPLPPSMERSAQRALRWYTLRSAKIDATQARERAEWSRVVP
jgi:hypothetical protein